jgi:dolichol-phosphate mannosyltransferase
LAGLGAGYIATQSPWWALAAFMLFASYVGTTAAFAALYLARTYRNGLQRPNAFIDHSRSILQPPVSTGSTAPVSVGSCVLGTGVG